MVELIYTAFSLERKLSMSTKDAKIVELNRFLNDLERAEKAGASAFEHAFNAPPSGMSVHELSLEKKFARVSSGNSALLGYSPAELVGKSPGDIAMLKQVSESALVRKLAPTAILTPSTRSFRRADGNEITLLRVERHIKNDKGGVIGLRTAFCEAPKEE